VIYLVFNNRARSHPSESTEVTNAMDSYLVRAAISWNAVHKLVIARAGLFNAIIDWTVFSWFPKDTGSDKE
jgi:hypothetical protein